MSEVTVVKRNIDGVFDVLSEAYRDNRGFLTRTFDKAVFAATGTSVIWEQESHSHTDEKHVLRGLHVSLPPNEEGKLITVIRGEVQWVVVDARKESPTFGKWDSVILSAAKGNGLFVQRGFAHGCLSLCRDCDLVIKADNVYSDRSGTGIVWNDRSLNINWQLDGNTPIVSNRDAGYGSFEEFKQRIGY